MQHIPYTNPDDVERDRQEKPVWPDLTLSGEDIHNAFCRIEPDESRPWGSLNLVAVRRYEALAKELNRELDGRQAWFEGEEKSITAVRCPSCGQMFTNFKLKEHPCI